MDGLPQSHTRFPNDLVDWAGHHSGGVKRLFDDNSGRSGKALLKTNLLSKLRNWADSIANNYSTCPRVVLLVGGPGNGKTEAIESTIRWLDESLACDGRLVENLVGAFHPVAGLVPRVVKVDAGALAQSPRELRLSIVQDASGVVGHEESSAANLLIEELNDLVAGDDSGVYLCCVNRGVLDDALIQALDNKLDAPRTVLEAITRAVTTVILRDLDTRFSRSINEGIEFVRKFQALSATELDLLKRLAAKDVLLSLPQIRRKRPTAASRVQHILRDFACRLVRRSICTRSAVVADAKILQAFQRVVEDEQSSQLYEVADQVERLLNNGQDFEVSLTTTFGQPLPPSQRQATLIVPSRHVGMCEPATVGRPRPPICFLEVGSDQSAQPIALTYDLFKAVKELERGLSPASLPRTVVALLDTTRARLAGPIVRDAQILRRSKIRIGTDGTVIARSWDRFVSRNEGPRQ